MVSLRRSLADRKARWILALRNIREHLTEVPYLEGDLKDLERVKNEVETLMSEQARLRSESQTVTKQIRTLARQADRIRGRLGASLKGYYGFDAERLIAFGFTPRRSKSREEETERRQRGETGQGEGPKPSD